jgi:hypothetical protein
VTALDPFALGGGRAEPGEREAEDQDGLEIASLDFEPAQGLEKMEEALSEPGWSRTMRAIGVDARIAYTIF